MQHLVSDSRTQLWRNDERHSLGRRLFEALMSPAAKPLRFLCTGGMAALVQLLLLDGLVHLGSRAFPAELIAFLVSAQVNFALSQAFTWRARRGSSSLAARWLAFHAMIASTAAFNLAVFAVADRVLPHLVAAVFGIIVGAAINFALGDQLVFRAYVPDRSVNGGTK